MLHHFSDNRPSHNCPDYRSDSTGTDQSNYDIKNKKESLILMINGQFRFPLQKENTLRFHKSGLEHMQNLKKLLRVRFEPGILIM